VKKATRILAGVACCAILIISWLIVISSKSIAEKQLILISQATAMIDDGIFIRAVPLLEEAAGYDAVHTIRAENELKKAYLALIGNRGFSRKYISLLEKQMGRQDADPELFIEAANYLLGVSKTQEALRVLRSGIEKTGDSGIVTLYESSRYAFETSRPSFDYAAAIYKDSAQVQLEGKWGIAGTDGTLLIPCEYDKISNFDRERAIVDKNGSVYAVDKNNDRIAVARDWIIDFRNFADNRIPLLTESGWCRSTGEFELGASMFEDFGMYCGGYAAAKADGKWGVVDLSVSWLIHAEYDEIIMDELGRCYAQGAVFVRSGDSVYLFSKGVLGADTYQDARPFSDEGYAAVKKNGKWGFIDVNGDVMIHFVYDDALSFGQHLAAVKQGRLWGYISKYGHIVIEAEFKEAKSFSGGSAIVLTERGWQFITLIEYKKGAVL